MLTASFALTAVWRLAMRLTGIPAVAFWTVLLTALYPVWFAQSTLAHADIFAAACALLGPGLRAAGALTRKPPALARRTLVLLLPRSAKKPPSPFR